MIDGGSLDEKIIAIPFGDPTYNTYYDIQELPKHVFEEMMHFFEVYKSLEHKTTTVKEICHRDEAMDIIARCIEAYEGIFTSRKGKKGRWKKKRIWIKKEIGKRGKFSVFLSIFFIYYIDN